MARHDPRTGFLRRTFFLQNIDKFLSQIKRKPTGDIHALIELRMPDLSITDKMHNAVFVLVPELRCLRDVNIVNIGCLSNRNMAIWISYSNNKVRLENLVQDISDELNNAAISKLGSTVPLMVVGGSRFNPNVSSQEPVSYTHLTLPTTPYV